MNTCSDHKVRLVSVHTCVIFFDTLWFWCCFFYYKHYLSGRALIVLAQYLLYWNCVTILSTGLSGIPFQSMIRNLWTTAFCQCLNIWTVSSLMGIQNWPLNYRATKWSHKKPWKGGPGGLLWSALDTGTLVHSLGQG